MAIRLRYQLMVRDFFFIFFLNLIKLDTDILISNA